MVNPYAMGGQVLSQADRHLESFRHLESMADSVLSGEELAWQ